MRLSTHHHLVSCISTIDSLLPAKQSSHVNNASVAANMGIGLQAYF